MSPFHASPVWSSYVSDAIDIHCNFISNTQLNLHHEHYPFTLPSASRVTLTYPPPPPDSHTFKHILVAKKNQWNYGQAFIGFPFPSKDLRGGGFQLITGVMNATTRLQYSPIKEMPSSRAAKSNLFLLHFHVWNRKILRKNSLWPSRKVGPDVERYRWKVSMTIATNVAWKCNWPCSDKLLSPFRAVRRLVQENVKS